MNIGPKTGEVTNKTEIYIMRSFEICSPRQILGSNQREHGQMRNAYKRLAGKPEGKRPFEGLINRWQKNIKICIGEIRLEGRFFLRTRTGCCKQMTLPKSHRPASITRQLRDYQFHQDYVLCNQLLGRPWVRNSARRRECAVSHFYSPRKHSCCDAWLHDRLYSVVL